VFSCAPLAIAARITRGFFDPGQPYTGTPGAEDANVSAPLLFEALRMIERAVLALAICVLIYVAVLGFA
jgi:hypothetical protein